MTSASPSNVGEEFRDDVRKRLPAQVLRPLTELSPLRSTLAIARTFALIILVLVFAVRYWSVWAALIAIVLIGPL